MFCRPAEKVCGCLPIVRAARAVCLICMVQGMLSMFSLFLTGQTSFPADPICHGDAICQAILVSHNEKKNDNEGLTSISEDESDHLEKGEELEETTKNNAQKAIADLLKDSSKQTSQIIVVNHLLNEGDTTNASTKDGEENPNGDTKNEGEGNGDQDSSHTLSHSSETSYIHPPKLTAISLFLEQLDTIFAIMALWAGMRGYAGVTLKSTASLRVMFFYVLAYTFCILLRFLRIPVICAEFPSESCDNARMIVLGYTGFNFFFFSYVCFILWSCLMKIVVNEDSEPFIQLEEGFLGGQELGENGGDYIGGTRTGSSALSALLRAGSVRSTTSSNLFTSGGGGRQNTLSTNNSPVRQPLEPFSGEPHRLE